MIYVLAGLLTTLDGIEFDKTKQALNKTANQLNIADDLSTPYLDNKKAAFAIVTLIWPLLAVIAIYKAAKS